MEVDAPRAPTGLAANANGETQIDLSWSTPVHDNGAAITGYKIEVSADAGTNWSDLVSDTGSTGTTYSHTSLTAGSTRHYRVSAINSQGTGPASEVANATTPSTTPTDSPLVSNSGQAISLGDTGNLRSHQQAQAFTTGSSAGGYTLTSVGIRFEDVGAGDATPSVNFTAAIYSSKSSTLTGGIEPDSSLARLTNPGSLNSNALNTFTASGSGIMLDKDTTYFILVPLPGRFVRI